MSSFFPDLLFSFWMNCLFVPLTLWINMGGGNWQILLMCFPVYLVMDPSDTVFLSLTFSYHSFQRYYMNILVWFLSNFFVFSRDVWHFLLLFNFPHCSFYLFFLFFLFVVNFVIRWNETAMGLYVFPIPIPPPTSLSFPSTTC